MIKKLLIIILLVAANAYGEGVSIISSSTVTYHEAVEIFSFREYQFHNGSKIKMVVLPRDHRTTRLFANNLGYSSVRFYEKAEAAFSTGRLNLLVVDNERDVIRYVSRTEGSIGYVSDYSIIHHGDFASYVRIR